ncbi:hypothetical protein F2Q69_00035967 [Brassica cretica]|uniref:Uncharacterized protein n=1 Tax=Brassica cretica TaxID=69181 RepID=A0A8S9SEA1_BRACR|nr:hypothetical protein F2Q69_00035967 [Brassica cretica]
MSPPSSPSSLDDAGDKSRRIYSRRHSYQSKIELSHINTYLKEISNQVTLISLEEFFSVSPPSLSFHFSPSLVIVDATLW